MAVWNAEAIAKLERGAADNDLAALQLRKGRGVTTQHVNKGDRRHRVGANAEVDQERCAWLACIARPASAAIEGTYSAPSRSPNG